MKRSMILMGILMAMFLGTGAANASSLTFSTDKLETLAHSNFYIWEISGAFIPEGEEITSATISFLDLNDANVDKDDIIYIDLLDTKNKTKDIITKTDNHASGDAIINWAGNQHILETNLTTYKDINQVTTLVPVYGWVQIPDPNHPRQKIWVQKIIRYNSVTTNPAEDFSYTFNDEQIADLSEYMADGFIAIGLDPDCHFSDTGITLTIETEKIPSVPEPATMVLFGSGLILMAGFGKRIIKK